ncbi:hypothetical protein NHQ30_004031 [Ciborinia camelliae]|nr:hypothetical protein NHQ30_004031 [Ciborinia camelliae]
MASNVDHQPVSEKEVGNALASPTMKDVKYRAIDEALQAGNNDEVVLAATRILHKMHDVVMHIRDNRTYSADEAYEFTRSLPVEDRYDDLDHIIISLASVDLSFEELLGYMIIDEIYKDANVSVNQFKAEKKNMIIIVKRIQTERQELIKSLEKVWGEEQNGMALAKTLIMTFGYLFVKINEWAKCTPTRALHLFNGELIDRLDNLPRQGKTSTRSLMPSDIMRACLVIAKKKSEVKWDEEALFRLNLRYNNVGMLGEPSDEYASQTFPRDRIGVEIDSFPKVCKCNNVEINKGWYSMLNEGYVAKAIVWMTMAELVSNMPKGLCHYHCNQLANALGLETTHIKKEDLLGRLKVVYDQKDIIDDIGIDASYYTWLRHNKLYKKEREEKSIGTLKFSPPETEELPRTAVPPHKPNYTLRERGYVTGGRLTIHDNDLKVLVRRVVDMYVHHDRLAGQSAGFAYHCYFAPIQQLARRDLKLWYIVCSQRLDGEYRLVTIPRPMMIIQDSENYRSVFTNGNAREIFGAAGIVAKESQVTGYILHDLCSEGQERSQAIDLLVPAKGKSWGLESHRYFDTQASLFDKGTWQDLTPKIGFAPFENALKKNALGWQTLDKKERSIIVAPGLPMRIVTDCGDATFAVSPIPFAAVKFNKYGQAENTLENGMSYAEVRISHTELRPIFDDNITKFGKHTIPKFPPEVRILNCHPVEQALVGALSWDDPMVVKEALRLLALPKDQFDKFYKTHSTKAKEDLRKATREVMKLERAYGERSFFNIMDEEAGGELVEEPDEDDELATTRRRDKDDCICRQKESTDPSQRKRKKVVRPAGKPRQLQVSQEVGESSTAAGEGAIKMGDETDDPQCRQKQKGKGRKLSGSDNSILPAKKRTKPSKPSAQVPAADKQARSSRPFGLSKY